MAEPRPASADPSVPNATVLVVDDSISVRKALERILVPHDFTVLSADSAERALAMLGDHDPDLIIADVVMPGVDGFELCRRLKSGPHRACPVLLISGIAGPDVERKAVAAGALGVVEKPFTADELIPQLRAALATKPTPKPTPAPEGPARPTSSQSSEITAVLEPFLSRQDIDGVMLVSTKGKVLFQLGELTNPAQAGVQIAALAALSKRLGGAIGQRSARSLTLEYADKTLLLYRVAANLYLVLVLTDLGAVSVARYLVKQQVPKLVAYLRSRQGSSRD
ncbi:MAG: response regulator [Trueperaceae bacterium]|nr:response regulator [Trueperaceae bacterium]